MPRSPGLSHPPAIMEPMSSRITTLWLTAKCSPSQHRRLGEVLAISCEMYKALFESCKDTYAWWKEHNPGAEQLPSDRTRSRYDLFKLFTQVRKEDITRVRCREADRGRAADFRLAHDLVTSFDGVAVEGLNIAGLLRSRRYSKKMSEQRWGAFDLILGHKSEKAGVPYVRVSPSHTSTDCSDAAIARRYRSEPWCIGVGVAVSACAGTSTPPGTYAPGPSHRSGVGRSYHPTRRAITNNHSETDSPLGAKKQLVAAEQYALSIL